MHIRTIKLENFQGIKLLETIFGPGVNEVRGTNASGKTTLANAIMWLLTDKPYTGEKGYTPKTRLDSGEEAHNLVHAVEAVVDVDGVKTTLRKEFAEKWTKKRGSTEATFSGHTVEYFVDGVPCPEKIYVEKMAAIIGDYKTALLLMRPDHFATGITWQERREILLDMTGDVSIESVIAANNELSGLTAILDKGDGSLRPIKDQIKISKERRKKLNKELDELPARIDEATRSIVADIPSVQDAATRSASAATGLMAVKTAVDDALKTYIDTANDATRSEREVYEAEQSKEIELNNESVYAASSLAAIQIKRESIAEKLKAAQGDTFDAIAECPTCNRPFSPEELESIRNLWNADKASKIEKLKQEAVTKEASSTHLDTAREKLTAANGALAKQRALTASLRAALDSKPQVTSEDINAKRAELEAAYEVVSKNDVVNECASLLLTARANHEQQVRITALTDRQKEVAYEYEQAEREVYLCETFSRAKADMLTESVNALFDGVRIVMYSEQINGGIADCCHVYAKSNGVYVPFASANHASQINAGLAIIEGLSQRFGRSLPVIIDNAESVVAIRKGKAQQIRLYVDANHPTLELVKEI